MSRRFKLKVSKESKHLKKLEPPMENTSFSRRLGSFFFKDRVFRIFKPIKYHIYSSLWSSMKDEFHVVNNNIIWLLGNGEKINFWNDSWCGAPLSQALQIPDLISQNLTSKVSDYISNGSWDIPDPLLQIFPILNRLVQQATIPLEPKKDQLLWKHSTNGDLDLKQAYTFKNQIQPDVYWAKTLWNQDITPSKSLLIWRLMHDKIPTYEKLA